MVALALLKVRLLMDLRTLLRSKSEDDKDQVGMHLVSFAATNNMQLIEQNSLEEDVMKLGEQAKMLFDAVQRANSHF